MKILLLGAKEHGTEAARTLHKLGHTLFVVYLVEEPHEEIYYEHLRDFAAANNISALPHTEAKDDKIKSLIGSEQFDCVLCIKWRFMLNKAVIDQARYGGFVVHDSILPKYRGFAPLNWSIISGENRVGATLLKLADEVDAGPIVAQRSFDLGENDDIALAEKKMVGLYRDILEAHLTDICDSRNYKSQNEKEATYGCMRRPEDSRIDWPASARRVHNSVRALAPPFPCAFTFYNGQKIEITKTRVLADTDRYAGRIPGRILGIHDEGIHVLTGQGILIIENVRTESGLIKANRFFKSIKQKLE